MTNLDFSKLNNNFKFYQNGRNFFKRVVNTVGKRRNCSLRAISPFHAVFLKDLYCRDVKTRACLGERLYTIENTCM